MNLPTLMLALMPVAAAEAPAADPRALQVAGLVMQALGGEEAWNKTRFLRFDFAVESEGKIVTSRSHYWDKWSGRYRVEGKTKEGKNFLVLMNLNSREGSAWQDGKPAQGDRSPWPRPSFSCSASFRSDCRRKSATGSP